MLRELPLQIFLHCNGFLGSTAADVASYILRGPGMWRPQCLHVIHMESRPYAFVNCVDQQTACDVLNSIKNRPFFKNQGQDGNNPQFEVFGRRFQEGRGACNTQPQYRKQSIAPAQG
jgi:hypothetical protein